MKHSTLYLFALLCFTTTLAHAAGHMDQLPVYPHAIFNNPAASGDWLIEKPTAKSTLYRGEDSRYLLLDNGLVRRAWRLVPNVACVALDNRSDGQCLLRATGPEALLTIDGREYTAGGLEGQENLAFLLPEELEGLTPIDGSMKFAGFQLGPIEPRFQWKRVRHHAPDATWPPKGIHLRFDYEIDDATDPLAGKLTVSVHYQMYDAVPLMSKWLTVTNRSDKPINVDRFTSERLAVVPSRDSNESELQPPTERLYVETDYSFGDTLGKRSSVHWNRDPEFKTQVSFDRLNPCLLEVSPEYGPDQTVDPGKTFESIRTYTLLYDGDSRERRSLARCRMYRTLAPWCTENPLMIHIAKSDPKIVGKAIDQVAECGFELLCMSFWSGFDMENESPQYLAEMRALIEYGAERGVEVGGYSLLASRRIKPDDQNCIDPETGKPGGGMFDFCPALASPWGQDYFRKLRKFIDETGSRMLENDGPYPGDLDAAARPPLQKGVNDSRFVQWRIITNFYKWLRERGVYLNAPDSYLLSGSNAGGMGYREKNWSLPRAQQVIHTRQNIHDGTWNQPPSSGWMFAPLTEYHGGGDAATIEPLDEHIDHYRLIIQSNLAFGVQACYRGLRLYDTPRVRDMVRGQVDWYKQYRDILESDIVHGRRANGRNLDWSLHVNPQLKHRGMLVVFNPHTNTALREELLVNVYYTGLKDQLQLRHEDDNSTTLNIDHRHNIQVPVNLPPQGFTWFLLGEVRQ